MHDAVGRGADEHPVLTRVGTPATLATGYGLIGLRERVELIGGTLTAGPRGKGWRLHATMPVTVPEFS